MLGTCIVPVLIMGTPRIALISMAMPDVTKNTAAPTISRSAASITNWEPAAAAVGPAAASAFVAEAVPVATIRMPRAVPVAFTAISASPPLTSTTAGFSSDRNPMTSAPTPMISPAASTMAKIWSSWSSST